MATVYIISGPAGVGKSTTAQQLVHTLKDSAYISGDYVSHMHVSGREKPWESEFELSLIWNNIISLAQNFISSGIDVVIDYVTFPKQAELVKEHLKGLSVTVVYTVLWVDAETLLNRDRLRQPEYQMGERCLILIEEFNKSGVDHKHLIETSRLSVDNLDSIVENIINNKHLRLIDKRM